MEILGIDIGGSGIKAAPVDLSNGEFTRERRRITTPQPATPAEVAEVIRCLVEHFDWRGPVGCTFPGVIKNGVTLTAANVDKTWIGCKAQRLFEKTSACRFVLLNDADAAGVAEMELGAGQGRNGVVILLTLGTGIGSAIFFNHQLLPNTEFGHMEIRGKEAEHRASSLIRKEKKLSWRDWSGRLNEVMTRMEDLFWPDLFIISGGVSRKYEKFLPLLKTRTPVVPAKFFNRAGIIGAALEAGRAFSSQKR